MPNQQQQQQQQQQTAKPSVVRITDVRDAADLVDPVSELRLIGLNGTSFRVNVVTGEVAVDGSLKYDPKDANTAKKYAARAKAMAG